MKRREAILGIALLAAVSGATAQQARKVPRIGVLHAGSSKETSSAQREPLERGLRALGWIPGSTVIIDYRYAEGNAARLPELAADLVKARVDVIVARGPAVVLAALQASATTPIVMSAGGDPVAEGLVKNLSRPGGNITGMVTLALELDAKRLELLKEAFPRISRVAVISNPSIDSGRYQENMAALQAGAHSLKMQLQLFEVRRAADIADISVALGKARPDALLVRGDPEVLDRNLLAVLGLAAKHRLPAMYWWRFFVESGGLMSYGINFPEMHYRAATYVSRILKGENAGELPIERPSKFELIVNVATAQTLGTTFPKAMLFRADEVLQ